MGNRVDLGDLYSTGNELNANASITIGNNSTSNLIVNATSIKISDGTFNLIGGASNVNLGNSSVNVVVGVSNLIISSATTSTTINASHFTGKANDSINLGGYDASVYATTTYADQRAANAYSNALAVASGQYVTPSQLTSNLSGYVTTSTLSSSLASYQPTATLAANVATLTANNATNLGGTAAASYLTTSGAYTVTGLYTFNADIGISQGRGISIGTTGYGASGQFLATDGTKVSWQTPNYPQFSVNTSAAYTWTGIHTHNAGVVYGSSITAGGSTGTSGQLLSSTGTGVQWIAAPSFSVNTAAQYTWTNTHTHNASVVYGSTVSAGGSVGTSGQVLSSTGTGVSWTTRLSPSATATITTGYTFTAYAINGGSLSSGSYTLVPSNGNYQYYTNNGAHTLVNPASDCAIDILITNGTAGAIVFNGFTVQNGGTGDPYDNTVASGKFLVSVRRINGISTYIIKALQ